ncbi:MAG TPA: hypothetical protein VK084_09750, partial [Chitinophagaceae bacterium]|nr:hypothetical protein [Chitinophagaceae bacterium]
MSHKFFTFFLLIGLCGMTFHGKAQTNTVKFGKNRLQFKLFDWQYLKTDHFCTYFSQNGDKLGTYVARTAETELSDLEHVMGYSVRDKINIIVYNSYQDMKQSNIGIDLDWQNTGGVTKLVGNKMIVYFDGNHNKLKVQIREGIAKVIVNNLLFGRSFGDFAKNSMSLNLPDWFTDGYVAFLAQHWNTDLDNRLKQLMKTGRYNTFGQLALDYPTLAGHAFWYFISDQYRMETPSYLVYISRVDRSMRKAFKHVLGKKYKEVMQDFITYNFRRYHKDNRGRRQVTKGRVATSKLNIDAVHYNIHPNPKNRYYALTQFKDGKYQVQLFEGYFNPTIVLRNGVRQRKSKLSPDYPLIAWNPKGSQLGIIYPKRGELRLLTYDIFTKVKKEIVLPEEFQMIQSFEYLPSQYNSILLSATVDGQSDIYTYEVGSSKKNKLTDDVYDDIDASFVGFAKKSGIIFSSNRPSENAGYQDSIITPHRYNVFILGNWRSPEDVTISQLTDLKKGNARKPTKYDPEYFTFVGDQNGIKNRYVASFKSVSNGMDTTYFIGNESLRSPSEETLDSVLTAHGLEQADSMTTYAVRLDSTQRIFPITNYADGITESYSAGQKQIVSETVKRGNWVRSYELNVNKKALDRKDIKTPPTSFREYQTRLEQKENGVPKYYQKITPDSTVKPESFFQSEFGYQPPDSSIIRMQKLRKENEDKDVLENAKLFPYHLKFSTDYLIAQIDNSVLISRYQPLTGGGPIYLQQPFNGLIQVGVSDLMEDIKFTGGFRVPSNFNGSEYYFAFSNLRHYIDFKALYYRKANQVVIGRQYGGKRRTNLFQIQLKYPLDVVRSLRLTLGYRHDEVTAFASDPSSLIADPISQKYGVSRLEYVYDNTINPATNIWKGLRWKAYMEMFP